MMGLLNLGSLLLGLTAWGLPLKAFKNLGHHKKTDCSRTLFLSLGACILALFFQVLYQGHLVKIQDWSALLDTYQALAWISGLLVLVTLVLNFGVLKVAREERP